MIVGATTDKAAVASPKREGKEGAHTRKPVKQAMLPNRQQQEQAREGKAKEPTRATASD